MSAAALLTRNDADNALGRTDRPGPAEPCGAGGFCGKDPTWGQGAMSHPEPHHAHPPGPVTSAPNVSFSPAGVAKDASPQHTPYTPTGEHEGGDYALSPSSLPQPSTRTPDSLSASRHETTGDSASEDSREESGSSRRSSASAISLRRKKNTTGRIRQKTSLTPRRFAGGGWEGAAYGAGGVDVKSLKHMLGSSMSRLDQLELDKMDRYERYKHEAMLHGNKLVEEERKLRDEEHNVLVKRIEFLTKELEEARRSQIAKTRECEELLEVAEELARDRRFGDDISTVSEASSAPRNWLQSPETSMSNASPEKGSGGKRECRVCSVGSMFASLGF